jgi:hypothetical protein
VPVPDPTPVDPEVAAALLRSHLEDFFNNSPRVRDGVAWAYEITENPLIAIVQMPACARDGGESDIYTLRRARIGTPAFPLLRGSPGAPGGDGVGFQFALHDDYQFPGEFWDQLICFSYNLGYYISNHTPNEDQKWRPGMDRVDATLSRIHTALSDPAYLGPSTQVDAA